MEMLVLTCAEMMSGKGWGELRYVMFKGSYKLYSSHCVQSTFTKTHLNIKYFYYLFKETQQLLKRLHLDKCK